MKTKEFCRHGMASQRGASSLVMLVITLFFGSLLLLAVKLGPIYLDDMTIRGTLEDLEGGEDIAAMSPRELRTLINKRLIINNIRNFDAKSMTINIDGDTANILVDYTASVPVIANIDALVHFEYSYELNGQ